MHQSFDDIEKLAELFLQMRIHDYNANIKKQLTEFQEHIDKEKLLPGPIARTDLIHHWIKEFESHCHKIVNDFIYLVETFKTCYALDFLQEKLDTHITKMAVDFNQNLSENDFGRIAATASERNRIINMVSSIKAQIKQNWQKRTKNLLHNKQTNNGRLSASKDFDDRLPVKRRGAFDHDLEVSVQKASHCQECLSLVLIDIDHFKNVNDRYGHQVGDKVLFIMAECVVKRLAHKGQVYRYGGEEFALILPTYTAEEAIGLSERLRKDIEEKVIGTKDIRITASFGVACFPEDAKNETSLLKKADTALYAAKKMGRNCVKAC